MHHDNFISQSTTTAVDVHGCDVAAAVPSPPAVKSGSQQGALDSRGEGSEAKHTSLRSSIHHEEDVLSGAAKLCAKGQNSYSFSRKRAFKRALARAGRDGFAHYRGRIMQAHELRAQYRPIAQQIPQTRQLAAGARTQASATIKLLTWNCCGFSTCKDELYTWLKTCTCDVVCLQETMMKENSEFVAGDWTCVQSGVGPSKSRGKAGVMIMLKRAVFDNGTIRYNHVIPGRVLHVRAQSKHGWVDVVGAYLHAWGGWGTEAEVLKNRSKVWTALRTTLGQLPRGNQLLLCGDFNTTLKPMTPCIGTGLCKEDKEPSADSNDMAGILQDFGLQAVNTFGKLGSYTYIQEQRAQQHRSFLDYVMVRRRGSTLKTASRIIGDCPVARWRGGGRHLPVIVTLHFRRFQFVRPRPQPQWPQWKCAILTDRIAQQGPEVLAFQERVARELDSLEVYSPARVNKIILQAGQQHFHIERQSSLQPPWAQPQHEHTIRNMWTLYRLAPQQFRRCASGLRACFRAWRCRARFQRLHKIVARNSRLLRRHRFDDLLRQAEAADYGNRVDQLFFLLRRHAPKQPRTRAQLRSSTGALLMPQAETKELAKYWKEVTTAATPTQAPPPMPFHIRMDEAQKAIEALPPNKAAPAHYAPHVLWQCAAPSVAQVLERGLLRSWRLEEATILEEWADAWLTFLQKPNKAGNAPQHLRPIALLDPVGKALTGILRQQLDTYIAPHMVTQHQYGFLPYRSVQQALGQVFMHCRSVRELSQAQRRSLYAQKAGHKSSGCAGGMQLSIDLTQAFDRVGRGLLEASLLHIGVPTALRSVLLRWVHAVHYVVQREGHSQRFGTTQGIRQGCRLSPSLWNCVVIYITYLLEQKLGSEWCRQRLVGYADDNLFKWTFHSKAEVAKALEEVEVIIDLFESQGLPVSKDKTAVLLRLSGSQADALRCQITRKVEGKCHLFLRQGLTLPIKAKHTYLGAVISFDRFEEYTAAHRCQAGVATYHRLRKHLHSKRAWPLHKRLRLWKAYVLPTVFYALSASGLTAKSAAQIRIELVRQLRAIAGRPRHLTLESDTQFLESIGMDPPLQALIHRQARLLQKTASLQGLLASQDVRLDPSLLSHEADILQRLQALAQPEAKTGAVAELPCPDCGECFSTPASLRQHRARVHRRGDNKPKGERFDRLLHGKDGLPQCINCGHKFSMWEELQRHVELGRCQASTRADYDDVHPPLIAKVLADEIVFPEVLLNDPADTLKKELLERCALCRQWLPNENYMKVHYGRVHPDEWKAHSSRLRVWCSNNIAPIKGTCQWCGHKAQQGRDHRATCPALFQLAMTWFVNGGPPDATDIPTLSDAPYPSAAEVKPLLGTCQVCHADISRQRFKTHMQRQHSELWRDVRPKVQLLCAAWEGSVSATCSLCGAKSIKKAEHVHTCVPLQQHALNICLRHAVRCGDSGCVRQLPAGTSEPAGGGSGGGCGSGTQRGSRHAESGQAVTTGADRGQIELKAAAGQGQRGPKKQGRKGPGQGQLGQLGAQQLGLQRLATSASPGTRTAGGSPVPAQPEAGGGTPAHPNGEAISASSGIRPAGDALPPLESCPGVEGGQGQNPANGGQLFACGPDQVSARGMGGQVRPHDQGRGDNQEDGGAGMGKGAGRGRTALELSAVEHADPSAGAGCEPTPGWPLNNAPGREQSADIGEFRDRAAHSQIPLHPQAHRNGCGRHDAFHPIGGDEGNQGPASPRHPERPGGQCSSEAGGSAHSGRAAEPAATGTTHCQNGGSAETLKAAGLLATSFTLHDRHGYMVACTLAWLMAGADHYDIEFIAGTLTHAVKSFIAMGPSFRLASSLPWRSSLQGWDHKQAGAMRWLQHILPKAAAPAMQGTWEARTSHDGVCTCTHDGDTWHPLCLQAEIRGGTYDLDLTALFSEWRVQEDRCALVQAPQILCVTSPRWLSSAAGEWRLISQSKAPTAVHVPCFSAEGDATYTTTYTVTYHIMSVVLRCASDGHFGARYWVSYKKTGWYSHANGKNAKAVKINDTTIHARYCDAVFLRRAEESADGGTA